MSKSSVKSNSKSVANIIKPLSPSEFNSEKIVFSNVIINTEIGNKYCKITYGNNNDGKLLVVARGCVIKNFKKL